MDNAMNLLSLSRKAGLAELGEEPVGAAARAGKARLILVAADASDHTWRRALHFAEGTQQQCVRMPQSKAEMGQSTGRECLAIAAITDPGLALKLLQALPDGQRYADAVTALTRQVQQRQRADREKKAHRRNRRFGKGHGPDGQRKND